MYSVSGLWSAAEQTADVSFFILNNRRYAILLGEYTGVGATPGPTAMDMLDLGRPDLVVLGIFLRG